jgi:hypothetical protein
MLRREALLGDHVIGYTGPSGGLRRRPAAR